MSIVGGDWLFDVLQNLERLRVIAELQRRDREAGIVEPPEPRHCDQCFEGCEKCQPSHAR